MGYATVSDVESLDSMLTFTQVSKPSIEDVVRFIENTAIELDSALNANDFQTPVPTTATAAYRLLTYYNALGADCLAQKAHPDSPKADSACKAWDGALKMLAAGKVVLSDAPRNDDVGRLRIRSSACAVATPFFTRDMEL